MGIIIVCNSCNLWLHRCKTISIKMAEDRAKCQMIEDWKWKEKEAILYFNFAYSRYLGVTKGKKKKEKSENRKEGNTIII